MIKLIAGEIIFLEHGEYGDRVSTLYTVLKDFDIIEARDNFIKEAKNNGNPTEYAQWDFNLWLVDKKFVEIKNYNHIDFGAGKELCVIYS